jgi:hypothetical protein
MKMDSTAADFQPTNKEMADLKKEEIVMAQVRKTNKHYGGPLFNYMIYLGFWDALKYYSFF